MNIIFLLPCLLKWNFIHQGTYLSLHAVHTQQNIL